MIVALRGIARLLLVWVPVWRRMFRDRVEHIVEVLWLLASPLAAYLAMAIFAVEMARGSSPNLQQDIGYCVLGLFGIVLRNSWKLTMEIASDKKEAR